MQQIEIFQSQNHQKAQKRHTTRLLKIVKEQDADFEWYATMEMHLQCIRNDLLEACGEHNYTTNTKEVRVSVLDCGAGDGRALQYLTSGNRYAIEKSRPLVEAMDKSIFVLGSDFHENTLLDKKCTAIFCNPPYSEYEAWASKIILEGQAAVAYLIIPTRWVNSQSIKQALDIRKFKTSVIGTFDFLDADRQARAKVDIVKIHMGYLGRNGRSGANNDAFDIWFDANFTIGAPETEASQWARKRESEEELEEKIKGDIVKRDGIVRLLDRLYQRDLAHLMQTYTDMNKISSTLLKELGINIKSVRESLRLKVTNLKDLYWRKLFDNLNQVTDKLCTATRGKLLATLTSNTHVDFNEANVVNVVIWILKQSNIYYEEQIITVFETMTEAANIELYKSNERTFKNARWRYNDRPDLGPYKLDYRVVLDRFGGYVNPESYNHNTRSGLTDSAVVIVNDLVTIANNLGFNAIGNPLAQEKKWEAGKPQYFFYEEMGAEEKSVLFEVRAFKKGTIHLRMSEKLIQKLNVVHGRLKGWINSPSDAVNEMDIPQDIAEEAFEVQLKLTSNQLPMLGLITRKCA